MSKVFSLKYKHKMFLQDLIFVAGTKDPDKIYNEIVEHYKLKDKPLKKLIKESKDDFKKFSGLTFTSTGGNVTVIWMEKLPIGPKHISTLSHEVLHFVQNTMESCGIPENNSTCEVSAYFLGEMIKHILTEFDKFNKLVK